MKKTKKPLFEIEEIVHFISQNGPCGIITDRMYYPIASEWCYFVLFGGDKEDMWYHEKELVSSERYNIKRRAPKRMITVEKHREIETKTNLIYSLVDICDSIVEEVEQENLRYKFDIKRNIKGLKYHAKLFKKDFNSAVRAKDVQTAQEKQSDLVDDSDKLKEVIYKEMGL